MNEAVNTTSSGESRHASVRKKYKYAPNLGGGQSIAGFEIKLKRQ